jgi:hypothetical protein
MNVRPEKHGDSTPTPMTEVECLILTKALEHLDTMRLQVAEALDFVTLFGDYREDWQAYLKVIMVEDVDDVRMSLLALIEADQARVREEAER